MGEAAKRFGFLSEFCAARLARHSILRWRVLWRMPIIFPSELVPGITLGDDGA